MNNDVIHVYPHIIQYTVYSTDIYTGNIIVVENVTGTQFTYNTQGDDLCPMYQISAWNAGGEGEKSEPVQESTPQGILLPESSNQPVLGIPSLLLSLLFSSSQCYG